MPYPNLSDIKVRLKMNFLDEKIKNGKKGLIGWNWYREEAMTVVNQSLGRLLRNKNDYGIMICLGIELKNNKFLFSNWIKNNMLCVELDKNNEKYYKYLENFLFNMNKIYNNYILDNKNKYNQQEEEKIGNKEDDS